MSNTRDEIVALIQAAGKYELRDENSEGMNAYAFIARHRPLDKDVFLKVYDADTGSAEVFREPRFLVEATTAGDRNRNLVEIYDAELLGDLYVLVAMEYVDGGSILRQLAAGPLGLMDALGSGVGILHGVARLHSAGLVHRDIKPANVLLTRRGNLWVPKLGDFGSVARLSSPNATVSASRHSALYVPPEGWAQPSCYGTRSDLYQVGMVMHEMVNGALPYDSAAYLDREALVEIKKSGASSLKEMDCVEACRVVERAIARRSSKHQLLDLGPQQPYEPKALRKVIRRATAPSPDDRYQTASEFIGALEALSFPNWFTKTDEQITLAAGWRGWDWRIEPDCKSNVGGGWIIRRSRAGRDSFRRWTAAPSIRAAAEMVAEAS
jgi:serine/threonine protein kinase